MTLLPLLLAAASTAAGDATSGAAIDRLLTEAALPQTGAEAPIRIVPDGDGPGVRAAVEGLRVEVRLAVVPAGASTPAAAATPPPAAAPAAAAAAAVPAPAPAASPPPAPAQEAATQGPKIIEVPPSATANANATATANANATPTATATEPAHPERSVAAGDAESKGTDATPIPPASEPAVTVTPPAPPEPTTARPTTLRTAPLRVAVTRTVESDGRVILTMSGPTGERLGRPSVRHVMDLPILSQRRDSWGRIVRLVNDGSGAPIEVLLDPMGRFLSARAVESSTAR